MYIAGTSLFTQNHSLPNEQGGYGGGIAVKYVFAGKVLKLNKMRVCRLVLICWGNLR